MKKIYLLLSVLSLSTSVISQTLFAPSGNVGTSSNNNVGIGISLPASQLHLKDASGGAFLQFSRGTGNAKLMMDNNSDKLYIATGTSSATQGLVIDGSGRIGIGNQYPTSQLHLKDASGGAFLQFSRGTGNAKLVMDNNLDKLYIVTGTSSATQGLVIDELGKVGIGNQYPTSQLHLKDASGGAFLQFSRGTGNAKLMMDNNLDKLYIVTGTSSATQGLVIDELGKVGIGTSSPDSKLTVAGNIHSREVKVTVNAGADFVFDSSFELRSLEETEEFITKNKHLPEVASANKMIKEGLNLGEMNIKLLQKVEELTLHMIKMNKLIKAQSEAIELLKNK